MKNNNKLTEASSELQEEVKIFRIFYLTFINDLQL
jgi:hypothetical protein